MSEIIKDDKEEKKKKKKSDLDKIADNIERLTGMKPAGRKKLI